jgi:voltage-gated potassium channel
MKWLLESFRRKREILDSIRKEKIPRLFIIFLIVISTCGIIAYYFEKSNPDSLIKTVSDGIWWGLVTITTVGYGDKYPITLPGKIAGLVIMFSGMVLTVLLSGTIASILVDRKMKEGKGLKNLTLTNHIIVCGWNNNGNNLLEGFKQLAATSKEPYKLVLVNEQDIDYLNELQFAFATKQLQIEIVRGNFTREQILGKANIKKASSIIILADQSGNNTFQNADERTVLAAYTVTNLNPSTSISVELFNSLNEQYLKNTNTENIIVNGEFNSFLLINSALHPGIPRAAKEIMNIQSDNKMISEKIPHEFVGKNFSSLFEYYKEKECILIGIVSEAKKLSIDDFLSDDPSSIDSFIKRKFEESEKDLFSDTMSQSQVLINPGWNYEINNNDNALVIGKGRP